MSRKVLKIAPLSHMLALGSAPFNAPYIGSQWPIQNVLIDADSIERRWDHTAFRTFADGDVVQSMKLMRKDDGNHAMLALTDTDLCYIRTGSGETYSYLTDTYTTGAVSDITNDVVTGASTNWLSSGLNAGDKFVLEADITAKGEPDATWATIESVDTDTKITLTANYAGTTGAFSPNKDYRARKVYSCPTGERWSCAMVGEKFCFTNGNVNVQYWDGTDPESSGSFATDLNDGKAVQARYCVAFADRLVLADLYNESTSARDQWLVRTSANGDPTKFYGDSGVTTAVDYAFIDTEEPITGLAVVGTYLVVFKKTMYTLGRKSGTATNPITFQGGERKGVGLFAPYSLTNYLTACAWLGVDDFYAMDGDTPTSIGGDIRKKFFEIVSPANQAKVFAVNNIPYCQIMWVAQTTEGQKAFVWDYRRNAWGIDTFENAITGMDFIGG